MSEATRRCLLCFRFATWSLWRRRHQFALLFLTLVAAFWAAFSILGLMTGSIAQLSRDLGRIGWDVINVHAPLDPLRFAAHGLTIEESDRLAAMVSGIAAPANLQPGTARASAGEIGNETERSTEAVLLIGTSPSWDEVLQLEFLAGRFFRSDEETACVVDQWAFRRLFPDRDSRTLRVDEQVDLQIAGDWQSLRVVGVVSDPFKIRERFEEWDITGTSRSYVIRFMDYKNIYVPRALIASGDTIIATVIRVGDGVDPVSGAARISAYLESKGSTALAWSRREWAQEVLQSIAAFSSLSHFVWVVVLVITAVMVVTMVLIIVRERFGEIAIRRVEGATAGQVMGQLLVENLLLTVSAAGLGLALTGLSGGWLERRFLGFPVGISAADTLLVGLVGTGIILLATALPARRAATLDPVQVLREK